jgi:hypothetical protein
MAVGISGDERMVRAGADVADDARHTRVFDMIGRPMRGWSLVGADGVRSDGELDDWVARGVGFARSSPPKG